MRTVAAVAQAFAALAFAALVVTPAGPAAASPATKATTQPPAPSKSAAAPKPSSLGPTSEPPHAYLFGAWAGGFFPPPSTMEAEECLSSPVVIFTRDVVLRASITDLTYSQRMVETARTTPAGTEFRFTTTPAPAADLGGTPNLNAPIPTNVGFGCENPQVLHVQRLGENQIAFPHCADFPYPLIRCRTTQ